LPVRTPPFASDQVRNHGSPPTGRDVAMFSLEQRGSSRTRARQGRGPPPPLAGGGGAKRRRNRKTPPFCLPRLPGEVARSAGGAKRRRNRKTPPFCLPRLPGEVARSAGGRAPAGQPR